MAFFLRPTAICGQNVAGGFWFYTEKISGNSARMIGSQVHLSYWEIDYFSYSLERFAGNFDRRLSLNAPIEVSLVFAIGRFYVRATDGWLQAIDRD